MKKPSHERQLTQRCGSTVRRRYLAVICVVVVTGIAGTFYLHRDEQVPTIHVDRVHAAAQKCKSASGLVVSYPYEGTLFPPDIIAPQFEWNDLESGSDRWLIAMHLPNESTPLLAICDDTSWIPTTSDWELFKKCTVKQPATVTIVGFHHLHPDTILSRATLSLRTSEDEVGAPIFYREVSLPFREAVLNTARHICWRFGPISSPTMPPIVLDNLPVCGNCHSFSADGKTLAMEVDSGNDKASYTVANVQKEIPLDGRNLLSWADFEPNDEQLTFGLLCQVSPDGRHVVGTVKDRALAVYRENLMFSQLFFLVKGFLATYDRESEEFQALPGADDPAYVQTNGVWSPDGKEILFARSRDPAWEPPELEGVNTIMVPPHLAKEFLSEEKKFLYDLYRIPFNGGEGGKAVPVVGASNNGMSNYFPKFSPDGKWIAFCKAKSFMLLQPDSELHIIPAEGGEARKLECNTPRMNSWHSWSPNSKWLVFSSKVNGPYTQLFLTHIDEQGHSSPPVLLRQFTSPRKAANIPEFVNAKSDAIAKIQPEFLDEQAYLRIGGGSAFYGNYDNAIYWFRKAIEINPENAAAYENWGAALARQNKLPEAAAKFKKTLQLSPGRLQAHIELGNVLKHLGMLTDAERHLRQAVDIDAQSARAHYFLGKLLIELGNVEEGNEHISEALKINPQIDQRPVPQMARTPS
jgi:Tol biopolymer transport system component